MEEEIIEAFVFHQHPLCRIPKLLANTLNWCYGCRRYFLPGDAIYGCSRSDCDEMDRVFHQECLEMPREIRHHVHPSHTLTLRRRLDVIIGNSKCAVCEWHVFGGMIYLCSGSCEQWIHMGCAGGLEDVADEDEKHPPMEHPSHPQHLLRFSDKTRLLSFSCDACGTSSEKENSYICIICNYWIHESCASLPASAAFPHHPNHSLSLVFHLPYEYILHEFECAICKTTLRLRSWVYHCQLCRYVVHIKCANDKSLVAPSNSYNNENAVDDEKNVIRGPIDDIYEEIIRPFIKRERGEILVPHEEDNKYKFHNHDHLLNFTRFSTQSSSSSFQDHNEEEEKEEEDDDDDNDDNIPRSELTCDGCTLAIHEKKQASSSTSCSYDEYDNGYLSCDECNYFLHLACFNLPLELPSLPLHPVKDHKLMLQNSGKLTDWTWCNICESVTNGLFYKCTKCSFKIDIKCTSLPNTIKHVGHPQHHHYLKLVTNNLSRSFCGACYESILGKYGLYRCDSCKFCMCSGCVLLPAHNKHRLENHLLSLTYDAYRYHSGDFYCGSCEDRMAFLKKWMYHCRDCDQSFHTACFPATSGEYRNINFGRQQYVISTIHHPNHLLRFQIISKKKRCDLCHQYKYNEPGFQCASCNFVMCLEPCSVEHINDFKAID